MLNDIDGSFIGPFKFILLPSPNRDSIEEQIRESALACGLQVFEVVEPHSTLNERRIGVGTEGRIDHAQPYELALVWPGPDICFSNEEGWGEAESAKVARDTSELIVYARNMRGTIILDDGTWAKPIVLATWLTIEPKLKVPDLKLGAYRHLSRSSSIALSLYLDPNDEDHRVEWGEDLFALDPKSTFPRRGPGIIDITGPPRKLVQGPFLYLFSGVWEIRARFSIDDAASKSTLRFEWGMPGVFSTLEVVPGKPGQYEVVLTKNWECGAAAEFIIELMDSAIDGEIHFNGATITMKK